MKRLDQRKWVTIGGRIEDYAAQVKTDGWVKVAEKIAKDYPDNADEVLEGLTVFVSHGADTYYTGNVVARKAASGMKNLKRIQKKVAGGHRGTIKASIKELVTLFGKYTDVAGQSSDHKVTTEWYFSNGNNLYSIYDYKETSRYASDLPSLEDFRINHTKAISWSVSGNCNADEFIEYVNQKLEELRAAPKEKPATSNSEIRSAFYGMGDHLAHLKDQKEFASDENFKTLVANLESYHDKLRKYLNENYRWD